MKMEAIFKRAKQTENESWTSTAEALAVKDAALNAALAYLESRPGASEWWRDEQVYRTHRLIERALETHAGLRDQPHNQRSCFSA